MLNMYRVTHNGEDIGWKAVVKTKADLSYVLGAVPADAKIRVSSGAAESADLCVAEFFDFDNELHLNGSVL